MRCSIVFLFTCVLVLSNLVAREGARVKHELLEQTAKYWVGQHKQGRYMWKRTSKRFSLAWGQGHDGRIREVCKKIGPQVCTKYMIT